MEAARFRLADLSLAEWSVTDAQHWHELAQAMTAWRNGQKAGGQGANVGAVPELGDAG